VDQPFDAVQIVRFRVKDQAQVRALILEGLADRWGDDADPTLNPDLDDIAVNYAGGTTLVAWLGDMPVGTGTVVPRQAGIEEVVRMSVTSTMRGRGVARRLLGMLVDAAATRGAKRVVCETCAHWESAVRLYLGFGFTITHYRDNEFCRDAYFALDLPRMAMPGPRKDAG
jgi:GNAT superfamily N-acetyltransferase